MVGLADASRKRERMRPFQPTRSSARAANRSLGTGRSLLSFLALLVVSGLAQSTAAASAASLPQPPKVCTTAQARAYSPGPSRSPCLLDYITGEDQPGFPAEWTNPDPTASHVLSLDVSPSQITVGGSLHISVDTGLPQCTTQLERDNTPCIVVATAGRPGFEEYYPAPKPGTDFSAYAIPELIPKPACLVS
jgi:hypothetical protein